MKTMEKIQRNEINKMQNKLNENRNFRTKEEKFILSLEAKELWDFTRLHSSFHKVAFSTCGFEGVVDLENECPCLFLHDLFATASLCL